MRICIRRFQTNRRGEGLHCLQRKPGLIQHIAKLPVSNLVLGVSLSVSDRELLEKAEGYYFEVLLGRGG